jgi:putative copper export protein
VYLRRSIGTEMILGSMILLVTAALTTLAGPGD